MYDVCPSRGVAHKRWENKKLQGLSMTEMPIKDPRTISSRLTQWAPYRLLDGHIMFLVKILLLCMRSIES